MKAKKRRSLTINDGLLIKFNTAMRKIADFYSLTESVDYHVKITKNIQLNIIDDIRREVTFLSEVGYGKLIPFHTFSRTVLHSSATNKPWINKKLFKEMNKSYRTIKTIKEDSNE